MEVRGPVMRCNWKQRTQLKHVIKKQEAAARRVSPVPFNLLACLFQSTKSTAKTSVSGFSTQRSTWLSRAVFTSKCRFYYSNKKNQNCMIRWWREKNLYCKACLHICKTSEWYKIWRLTTRNTLHPQNWVNQIWSQCLIQINDPRPYLLLYFLTTDFTPLQNSTLAGITWTPECVTLHRAPTGDS